jgi:hypothetical protein
MDSVFSFILIGIIAVIWLAVAALSAAREIFAWGRLRGIEEATYELTGGVSAHYETNGKPIPKRVAKRIGDVKAWVSKASGTREKSRAYRMHLRNLGHAMGVAAWRDGFEAGQRITDPKDGDMRIDLSLKELMNIHRLAHFGFENMMWDKEFTFRDKKDAEEATHAIERLERRLPKQQRNPNDPRALSFNRQTMIWDRWSSEKRAAVRHN